MDRNKFKLLSQHNPNRLSHSKPRKLCLTKPKYVAHELLTDDELEDDQQNPGTNSIILNSSNEEKCNKENDSDSTFCSEIEQLNQRNEGSESLFSTVHSEEGPQLCSQIPDNLLGEMSENVMKTLKVESDSYLATTLSNTSSYLEEIKKRYASWTDDSDYEKGLFEPSEKSKSSKSSLAEGNLDETEEKSLADTIESIPHGMALNDVRGIFGDGHDTNESLADTLEATPSNSVVDYNEELKNQSHSENRNQLFRTVETNDNSQECNPEETEGNPPIDEIITISSRTSSNLTSYSYSDTSNSCASVISIASSTEFENGTQTTRQSSQFEEIVSEISETANNIVDNSALDRFFNNIPPLVEVNESAVEVESLAQKSSADIFQRAAELSDAGSEFADALSVVPETESEHTQDEMDNNEDYPTPTPTTVQPTRLKEDNSHISKASKRESNDNKNVEKINISAKIHIKLRIEMGTPESDTKCKVFTKSVTPKVKVPTAKKGTPKSAAKTSKSNKPEPVIEKDSTMEDIQNNNEQNTKTEVPRSSEVSSSATKPRIITDPKPGPSREVNNQPFHSPASKSAKKTSTKDVKNLQNAVKVAHLKETDHEINEDTEKLLNDIYGNSWQTPDLLQQLSSRKTRNNTSQYLQDASVANFSHFKNIKCNLESTRLTQNVLIEDKNATASFEQRRSPLPELNDSREKDGSKSQPSEASSITRARRQTKPKKFLDICDTDTESENHSDESWCGPEQNSSDSDFTPSTRIKNNRKAGTTRSEGGTKKIRARVPSYSGSSDEETIWTDKKPNLKSPEYRLNNILDSCEFKGKPNVGTLKSTKTKRKLYNPNQIDEEIIKVVDEKEEDKENISGGLDEDISRITDDLLTLSNFLNMPVNKQLENVKNVDTGVPKIKTPIVKRTPKKFLVNADILPTRENEETLGFLESLDVNVPASFCDPLALHFRQHYKDKKHDLVTKLLDIFDDGVFEGHLNGKVPVIWNKKLLATAGRCCLNKKGGQRTCRVELSEKVLTSADRLRCTLIHELCHAATWLLHGEDGHGRTWKAYAAKANKKFPVLPKINICHSYNIEYKYTYKCTVCKAASHAHSKNKKVENIRCKFCHGAIEILLNKKDKQGQIIQTPTREAKGFAKFVKDQYKNVKTSDMNHGECMKRLGELFAATKLK